MTADNDGRQYCHCGNIALGVTIRGTSQITVRYPFLAELRREGDARILFCRCCASNVARLFGVDTLADLDKAREITITNAIDEDVLKSNPEYSNLFQLILPTFDGAHEDTMTPTYPRQVQDILESAIPRQRAAVQAEILEFTRRKKEEFRTWLDQVRKEADALAGIVPTPPLETSPASVEQAISISRPDAQTNSDLFQKSPIGQYTHPGASPLAAASLTPSFSDPLKTPSPPSKITLPPVPLSSSLKSPGSLNQSKTVKRVMFQDLPDEAPSDADDEIPIREVSAPDISPREPIISVDDEVFDFDETIPVIETDSDHQDSSPSPSSLTQPVRSPLFAPPLSPFRRRSIEKYDLSGGEDEDPFDDPQNQSAIANGITVKQDERTEDVPLSSSSKPIAITPPSRSFLAKGLGMEEDDDDRGMEGLIERVSLKNTRSGRKGDFADQKLLSDIPGDYYRSITS